MSRDLDHRKSSKSSNRLEAVIVCVNYPDFLEVTLPHNKQFFDSVTVVTSFKDKETHKICRYNNIDPVKTECFYEDGNAFNKAKGINLGLAHLTYSDWVIHLDADILLPHDFRNQLFAYPLQKNCLYGADRYNVIGRSQYNELVKSDQFKHQYRDKFIHQTPLLEQGARLVHKEFGYVPIGYFQAFHGSYLGEHQLKYPINQQNAERSDVQFALQWERQNRILLPTVSVFHLESERAKQGANWNGRTTAEF